MSLTRARHENRVLGDAVGVDGDLAVPIALRPSDRFAFGPWLDDQHALRGLAAGALGADADAAGLCARAIRLDAHACAAPLC
eukprot:885482-Alexandrium_andersonii.AAC.1